MKTTPNSIFANIVCILLVTALTALATEITWPVKIVPAGSAYIEWSSDSPAQSGNLTKSGSITFNSGANLNFRFVANSGYKLIHVYKNTEDEIAWVNANGGKDSFGPVSKPHTIIAVCELINPTGTLSGNYTEGKNITAIADVTGNYQGNATVKSVTRTYNADVAMDESGKLSAMGTLDGFTTKDGNATITGSAGSVKTVDDKPYAALKGGFNGMRDGKPCTGTGAASGELAFVASGNQTQLEGQASGSAVVDGEKKVALPASRAVDVPAPDVSKLQKSWGLALVLSEITPAKGKKYVEATATLRLSNGEYSRFAAKKVTYSAKNGYVVSFASGKKLDTKGAPVYVKDPKTGKDKLDSKGNPIPVVDRKSTVKLSKMILSESGGKWTPVSGTMEYKFLGQKGKGGLAGFLE